MASFPTSVISFTTKNSGDTIQASHVNTLQTEVNAIEDGYLNATARLNSSHSTLVALSVTGGSTLASLTVSGGSTLATLNVTGGSTLQALTSSNSTIANLSVTGNSSFATRPVMPPPDAVRLQRASSLTVGSGSTTAVAWTNQVFITNSSLHSTTTNPSHVTFQSTGVYQCIAQMGWRAAASTTQQIQIEDSSGGIIGFSRDRTGGVNVGACVGVKRVDDLSASPWVRVVILSEGSTNSVAKAPDDALTYFAVMRMG